MGITTMQISNMSNFDFNGLPHRRFNPLTESWILVSPHRTQRPWQGQVEKVQADIPPSYDPDMLHVPQ